MSTDGTLNCILCSRKVVMYNKEHEAWSLTKTGRKGDVYYIKRDTRFSQRDQRLWNQQTAYWPAYQRDTINTRGTLSPFPWGWKSEEVIDSSHHNLWEGQTLPFPFWVTRVIILQFWKGSHKGYFCLSVMARHWRVWSSGAPTNSRCCSVPFPGTFPDICGDFFLSL